MTTLTFTKYINKLTRNLSADVSNLINKATTPLSGGYTASQFNELLNGINSKYAKIFTEAGYNLTNQLGYNSQLRGNNLGQIQSQSNYLTKQYYGTAKYGDTGVVSESDTFKRLAHSDAKTRKNQIKAIKKHITATLRKTAMTHMSEQITSSDAESYVRVKGSKEACDWCNAQSAIGATPRKQFNNGYHNGCRCLVLPMDKNGNFYAPNYMQASGQTIESLLSGTKYELETPNVRRLWNNPKSGWTREEYEYYFPQTQ